MEDEEVEIFSEFWYPIAGDRAAAVVDNEDVGPEVTVAAQVVDQAHDHKPDV